MCGGGLAEKAMLKLFGTIALVIGLYWLLFAAPGGNWQG